MTEAAANAALDNYTSDNEGELLWAAVSAGLALEAVIKYSIAKANPVLLADPKSGFGSAILLARHDTNAFSPRTLRTVTGAAAVAVFRALHANRKGILDDRDCGPVFAVRNSAVHMGLVEPSEVRAAVKSMVVAVQSVLELEEGNDYEIWREANLELVEALIDERTTEAQRATAEKKAVATRRYETLVESLPRPQREQVITSIERLSLKNLDEVNRVSHRCPVCGRDGLLVRYVTRSGLDFTGFSYPDDEPRGERYAYPEEFDCFVCGLNLDEAELAEDHTFEDIYEEEVGPSEEFERALEDWRYEERAEQRREELRDEWRRDFDA